MRRAIGLAVGGAIATGLSACGMWSHHRGDLPAQEILRDTAISRSSATLVFSAQDRQTAEPLEGFLIRLKTDSTRLFERDAAFREVVATNQHASVSGLEPGPLWAEFLAMSVACTASDRGGAPSATADLAITRVNVVDVESGRALPDHTVLIEGNQIVGVGPSEDLPVPGDTRVVDGAGKYLIPGLVDTHVHLTWDEGADVDSLPLLPLLVANGVTTIREASGRGREGQLIALRDRIERGELLAPRLYVSGTASRRSVERYGVADLPALVRTLGELGVDGIKVINLNVDDAVSAIREARRLGLSVYGHAHLLQHPDFPYGLKSQAKEAIAAGISGVMHAASLTPTTRVDDSPDLSATQTLEEAMAQLTAWFTWYSQVLVDGWLGMSDEDLDELMEGMVTADVWLEPTFVIDDIDAHRERYRDYPGERYADITVEDLFGAGLPTEAQVLDRRAALARMGEFVRRFRARGGLVLAGSDNAPVPGVGLAEELAVLVEAGLTTAEALQAATSGPAHAFGRADRIGTVEAGKLADLVLLSADPLEDIQNSKRIQGVVMNGRWLDRPALDTLLAEAERAAGGR